VLKARNRLPPLLLRSPLRSRPGSLEPPLRCGPPGEGDRGSEKRSPSREAGHQERLALLWAGAATALAASSQPFALSPQAFRPILVRDFPIEIRSSFIISSRVCWLKLAKSISLRIFKR
jgi:hypothetical protein